MCRPPRWRRWRPSSSAAYNVGDVVDTPDSAIKSWRYLGAGEWEPNDAVRYTTSPGGGIGITQIVSLTQSQYGAIVTKDAATLYVIVEG